MQTKETARTVNHVIYVGISFEHNILYDIQLASVSVSTLRQLQSRRHDIIAENGVDSCAGVGQNKNVFESEWSNKS